jgi:hypothetical protein
MLERDYDLRGQEEGVKPSFRVGACGGLGLGTIPYLPTNLPTYLPRLRHSAVAGTMICLFLSNDG